MTHPPLGKSAPPDTGVGTILGRLRSLRSAHARRHNGVEAKRTAVRAPEEESAAPRLGEKLSDRGHHQHARVGCPSGTARRPAPPPDVAQPAPLPCLAPISCAAGPSCVARPSCAPACVLRHVLLLYASPTAFSPAFSCPIFSCPTSSSLSASAPPVKLPKRRANIKVRACFGSPPRPRTRLRPLCRRS